MVQLTRLYVWLNQFSVRNFSHNMCTYTFSHEQSHRTIHMHAQRGECMIVRYEKVIFARFHLELSTSHTCIRVYTREHQPLRSRRCASVVESMHTVFCIFLRLDTDIFEFHEQRGESTTDSTINFDFHHDSRPYFDSA